jgi:mRNA interferase MazF
MGKFVVGDVVAVPFPFSDLSGKKLRPAVVLAAIEHDDLILCQITSNSFASKRAIEITDADFLDGGLPLTSHVRPDKLFTAESSIIQKHKGKLRPQRSQMLLRAVQAIFIPD